ncbi:hypothetical protein B9D04_01555 [Weissella cibaria]|uniref:InlB B-repeat-containing protein n=1 Tax=Weissella cibaria TaxID=137591 RepID=A0A1X4JNX5_9LACO|nr:InlB B-repeat-containing protein [Weissella cibaria]MDH5012181.1 InlB B-repeat-containing protein [Weissella cibaria]OSP90464.1 hypothetical protein B9D04_01555 [Weissella cibaria]
MNKFKRTTMAVALLATLAGSSVTVPDVQAHAMHGHVPMLRQLQMCKFKAMNNKHINVRLPKYVVANSKDNINYESITSLLSTYKVKGHNSYTVTGFGKPQTLRPGGASLDLSKAHMLKTTTMMVDGKKVEGYVGNVLIKTAYWGHLHLQGTLTVKLFVPKTQTVKVTFNAGMGTFATGSQTSTVDVIKGEKFTNATLPVNPVREGYVFTGWTRAVTDENGNVTSDKLAPTVDLTSIENQGDVTYYPRWGVAQTSGDRVTAQGQDVNFIGNQYRVIRMDTENHRMLIMSRITLPDNSLAENAPAALVDWYAGLSDSVKNVVQTDAYPVLGSSVQYGEDNLTTIDMAGDTYAFVPSFVDMDTEHGNFWQTDPSNSGLTATRAYTVLRNSGGYRTPQGPGRVYNVAPAFWVNY